MCWWLYVSFYVRRNTIQKMCFINDYGRAFINQFRSSILNLLFSNFMFIPRGVMVYVAKWLQRYKVKVDTFSVVS